ncbi:MAG: phage protease [Kiritimatiellae bacterium]|nr:phage protease [Kiritimatiellia bacterium]
MAANEFQIAQDNSFFVPFGDYDWRRTDGQMVIQRFDEDAGKLIASAFNVAVPILGRFVRKPVYIGHPDVPGNETRWPDKKSYGWITGAEIVEVDNQRGVRFACKWSQAGQELVANGHFLFYSPYWGMIPAGHADNGRPVYRPAKLVSMGLVNDPNIPVPAMANENQKGEEHMDKYKELLAKLAKALGMAADATEEAILAKAGSAQSELAAATQAKATAEQAKTTAETAVASANEAKTAAEQAKATAETELAAAETKAANERTARINDRLELAVNAKQITEADKPNWLTAFNENFDAAATKLQAVKPLGGDSVTQELGGRQSNTFSAHDAMLNAVNEVMAAKHISFQAAWNEVETTKPELAQALKTEKK